MEVKYDSGFCITNGYNEETRKTAKVSLRLWDSKTEVDKAEASSVSGPRTYRYMFEAGKSKRVEITEYNDVIRLYHIRTYSNGR